jgi:hypothetical protein
MVATLLFASVGHSFSSPVGTGDVTVLNVFCNSDGWPTNGSRVYWKYWKWPSQPSLYDIFLDQDHLVVILSFRFSYRKNCHEDAQMMKVARKYSLASWVLVRSDDSMVNSTFTKNDLELHSKVLIFPYDRSFGRVVTIRSFDPSVVYEEVPFCELPRPVKRFGAICTQNFVTEKERVLDWLAWHRAQGFDHAFLYINEVDGASQMIRLLEKAIASGSLTLVDWGWPAAYDFHDQPLAQASCLWRSKGRFTWLGMNDLDKSFLPRCTERVSDGLNRYESEAESFGSIACCNRWLSGNSRVYNFSKCARECVQPPRQQKNIVRVDNVDYFCNHHIMLGLPERQAKGLELVNGHLRMKTWRVKMESCALVPNHKMSVEHWIRELS